MVTLMVFFYTLEMCLVIWKQYKLVCENMTNMLLNNICEYMDVNVAFSPN
jgi:hypothetical protein